MMMVKGPAEVTPVIEQSLEPDGHVVFSGRFEELPGVIVEGNSEEAVLSELLEASNSLRQRLGWDTIVVKTREKP